MAAQKKQVLVVEDEMAMARALEMKFKQAGFQVAVATNGEEGLQQLAQTPSDVILLDLMMPKMDGLAFLEALRAQHSKIPVIVATNISQEDQMRRAKELGVVDYFVKSDTPIHLIVAKVKEALGV